MEMCVFLSYFETPRSELAKGRNQERVEESEGKITETSIVRELSMTTSNKQSWVSICEFGWEVSSTINWGRRYFRYGARRSE